MMSGGSLHRRACPLLLTAAALAVMPACSARDGSASQQRSDSPRLARNSDKALPPIRRVSCIYPRQPFLNLDAAGDRDPEGIHYNVYLDTGQLPTVLRDGTFHIEMFVIERVDGVETRELVSDWHYPASAVTKILPRSGSILGPGYLVSLRWADKNIAGKDIEMVTRFEDEYGQEVRAETKSFRVPRYSR